MDQAREIREFVFEEDQTCKMKWVFEILHGEKGAMIENIEIIPFTTSKGVVRGCVGHPKTIVALLKGQLVSSLDIDALLQTQCVRELSCGQALGQCLMAIRDGKEIDASQKANS